MIREKERGRVGSGEKGIEGKERDETYMQKYRERD